MSKTISPDGTLLKRTRQMIARILSWFHRPEPSLFARCLAVHINHATVRR